MLELEKVYRRWRDVPATLATRTQLQKKRLRIAQEEMPVAFFRSRFGEYPLYRVENGLPMKPRQDVCALFAARYPNRRAAYQDACEALFHLNRYAKDELCTPGRQKTIYWLKNRWLAKLWQEGFCVGAVQVKSPTRYLVCWDCEGEGCAICRNTGVFRRVEGKPYWALRFVVGEQTFAWHQPAHLATWAQPLGEEPVHEVLATEKPVLLPARKFAEAKALLLWALEEPHEA